MSEQKHFSFAIMANQDNLKAWQLQIIEALEKDGHRLDLIILPKNSDPFPNPSKKSKYWSKNALWYVYERLFLRRGMQKNIDCQNRLGEVDHLEAEVELRGKYNQFFSKNDVDYVQSKKLDFILRFGFNIIKGDILQAAKYGLWSFHHDNPREIRGGPPGFWEIVNRAKTNGILLQRLGDRLDGGYKINYGEYSIIRHSYVTHINEMLRYGVKQLLFAVRQLQQNPSMEFELLPEKLGKIYRKPSNALMMKFFLQLVWNRLAFNFRDLFFQEDWNIGIAPKDLKKVFSNDIAEDIVFAPSNAPHIFKADGHHVEEIGNAIVYYERYDYKDSLGKIYAMDFDGKQSKWTRDREVLRKNTHLAFPIISMYEGKRGLMPENSVEGPLEFIPLEAGGLKQSISMKMEDAVDAVVFENDNMQWLFCTHGNHGANQFLFLYFRKNSLEEWKSHPQNPIVNNSSRARMAGNIFKYKGQWIRPAQKNNNFYGEAIRFFEITQLTPEYYKEKEIVAMRPDRFVKYNKGIHTISIGENFVVMDAKKYKFVAVVFYQKLKRKLGL